MNLERDGVAIGSLSLLAAYGLSTARAGWGLVRDVQLHDAPAKDAPANHVHGVLQVSIPEIHYQQRIEVATGRHLPEHTSDRRAAVEAALEAVARPLSLVAHCQLDGVAVGGAPVTVLPPWAWAVEDGTLPLLAAFVIRGDARDLRRQLQAPGFEDVRSVAAASYEAVLARSRLRYEKPRLQEEPWSGCRHQSLRPPQVLLDEGVTDAHCVDVSVLLAGFLESVDRQPLLVLTGDDATVPEHCMLGLWNSGARRFRPLLDNADEIRKLVAQGELLVLESTGLCEGEHRLSFEEAVSRGTERVAASAVVQAVDIAACRPPSGTIAPLIVAHGAVVAQALLQARSLAQHHGAPRHETVHLLYGLCAAEGELATWLLQSFDVEPAVVMQRIAEAMPPRTSTQAPVPTRNYNGCLAAARANARAREAHEVAEGDLLWAVLENPSSRIRQVLESVGCKLSRLQRELNSRCARPGLSTSVSWTSPQVDATSQDRRDA